MATFRFLLDKSHPNAAGACPVEINFSHKGVRRKLSIQENIRPKDVDEKKLKAEKKFRVKSQIIGASDLNARLERIELDAATHIRKFKDTKKPFTADDLRDSFIPVLRGESEIKVTKNWQDDETLDAWIEDRRKLEAIGHRTGTSLKSRAKQFIEYFKGSDNEALNVDALNDYVDYMLDEKLYEPAFVKKRLEAVRLYLNYLNKRGLAPDDVKDFKPTRKIKIPPEAPAIFLTDDEYQKLLKYQPGKPHLQRAKDLYILIHNTSLRHSDAKVDRADVAQDHIHRVMRKTGKKVSIPIANEVLEILKRYNGQPPYISDQKFNDYLKIIGENAGIDTPTKIIKHPGGVETITIVPKWQVMTSKIGRKSLVSGLLAAGINEKFIRDHFTGHARPINLDPYIGFESVYKKKALKALNRKKKTK